MTQPIPIDWSQIDTVFLDMDGTLLDLHYDNHFWLEHMPQRYAEKHSITLEQARKKLMAEYRTQEGTLNWYCIDHWQEALQMDIVTLKHEVADRIAVREHVIDFLQHLHQLNKRVVLLTNAHQKTVKLKFEYTRIEPFFDNVITSHEVGLAKEQAGFWEALQSMERFDAAHSLFIDDNLDVLNAARGFGVRYLLAIHQPDSQLPAKDTADYTAIKSYKQLFNPSAE